MEMNIVDGKEESYLPISRAIKYLLKERYYVKIRSVERNPGAVLPHNFGGETMCGTAAQGSTEVTTVPRYILDHCALR